MDCPSCGSANPEGKKFCGDCGAPLPLRCAACGAENPLGKKFCGDCGAALTGGTSARPAMAAAPPPTPMPQPVEPVHSAAERRPLTVMFCDLVGSTALSTRVDPEDLRELVNAYHRSCAERAARFGGNVAKYMGDGVLMYFGYPEAHEDDATRAVHTALAILEGARELTSPVAGLIPQVRLGIATGLVVVGDLIGEGTAQERNVLGETPNLAARLQSLAEPGTVVIDQATRRLAGRLFEYRDLGHVSLKGFPEPVPAWEVLRPSAVESRFEALRSGETPLVGRDEELELLLRRWQQATSGAGRVVLLAGEPGIGKSRLTTAFQERLRDERHLRVQYFCSSYHSDSALHPIIMQLQRAAGFEREDTPGAKLSKMEALLAPTSPSVEDLALLADLLSLPASDRYPSLELAPQRKKEKTFEALLRNVGGLALRQPVLMVFEDIHWADPTSRELLDLVIDRVRDLPVLLLLTFRPEFQPPWTGQAHVTALALNRLGRPEGTALVQRIAGDRELSSDLLEEIIERTDGVPLFVEELTKAVIEAAADSGGDKGVIAAIPRPTLAVPATLHASLMARLDRLGLTAKEVAQIGAAIGREFSYEQLDAVARLEEAELRNSLDRLAQAGLIFTRGRPPLSSYTFKHALVQDAAYGTLLRDKRRGLHARIARALENQSSDTIEARPEIIAHHCARAGLDDKAIEYWYKAAAQANGRSANFEGMAHVNGGLALLSELPETAKRQRLELELQVLRGGFLLSTKGNSAPEVQITYSRVLALSERLGETRRQTAALLGLARYYMVQPNFREAKRCGERLLTSAKDTQDYPARLAGHNVLGVVALHRGDASNAREHFAHATRLHDSQPSDAPAHDFGAHDPGVACLVLMARTLWVLGYPDQALDWSRRAQDAARALGRPFTLFYVLVHAARVRQNRREPDLARGMAEEAVTLATEHGFPFWRPIGEAVRAWGATVGGGCGAEAGAEQIRSAVAMRDAMGTEFEKPYLMALLAEVLADAGHCKEGCGVVAEGLSVLRRTEEHHWEAELHRLDGELLLLRSASDDNGAAEACFRRAIDVAQEQAARLFELRSAVSLARLWRDQGKSAEAHNLVAPVYGWFSEGFDTLDLNEAKALLNELRE